MSVRRAEREVEQAEREVERAQRLGWFAAALVTLGGMAMLGLSAEE